MDFCSESGRALASSPPLPNSDAYQYSPGSRTKHSYLAKTWLDTSSTTAAVVVVTVCSAAYNVSPWTAAGWRARYGYIVSRDQTTLRASRL